MLLALSDGEPKAESTRQQKAKQHNRTLMVEYLQVVKWQSGGQAPSYKEGHSTSDGLEHGGGI